MGGGAASVNLSDGNVLAEKTFSQKSPIPPQTLSATRCNKKVFG